VRDQLRLCFLVWNRFHREGLLGYANIVSVSSVAEWLKYKSLRSQFLRHKNTSNKDQDSSLLRYSAV